MADKLNVYVSTVSKRLKAMGVIQRQGHWVPYQMKPRDIERRLPGANFGRLPESDHRAKVGPTLATEVW